MNEELTTEVLEALGSCMNACGDDCKARGVCLPGQSYVRRKLATALLEERAKPKVWDGAPEDAVSAVVTWCRSGEIVGSVSYNRELPKTRARQIAENIVRGINDEIYSDPKDIEYVEGVLKFALGLSAKIEKEMISERTKSALRMRKEKGMKLGRPAGKSKLDERKVEIEGYQKMELSKAKIAKLLGCSRTTYLAWLEKESKGGK